MQHRTRARRVAAGITLALAITTTAAACGDDETSAAGEEPAAPDDGGHHAGGGGTVPVEACDAYVALSGVLSGDPSQVEPVLEAFVETAPEDLADAARTMADGYRRLFESEDPGALSEDDYVLAASDVATAYLTGCSTVEVLDVKGVDYGFEGLPEEVPAGRVGIRFTNATEHDEPHEMVLAKRGEGVTERVEELLALPEEEAFSKLEVVGVVFADMADQEVDAMFDLEPGSYIAVCFIPIGGGEEGPPHFTGGMVAEFDVVA